LVVGGNDVAFGGGGGDYLRGWHGNDRLYGGKGNDPIDGNTGNDYIYGGPGDDRIEENDLFQDAPDDFDTVYGGPDNDTIVVKDGDNLDVVCTGTGKDTVTKDGEGLESDLVDDPSVC
jgi:hemolysin A